MGVHYFGEDIARKETVFTQLYTYQVPVSPGSNATKTVIRKPAVYVAVNKLFKYYKKSTKNGDLTYNKAAGHYDKTLNIALSIFYQQSEDFEEEVSKIKDIEDLAKLFEAVVLISQ